MLIYHQHHDIYHCTLRMLSIVSMLNEREVEFSKLRIIDFYLVFPHLIPDISFPRRKGIAQFKKTANLFPEPYELLPERKRLFSEMGGFQIQAGQILKAKQLISENRFSKIEKAKQFENKRISLLISDSKYLKDDFYLQLVRTLEEIPLLGNNGLKHRTGLMEYRYDAV